MFEIHTFYFTLVKFVVILFKHKYDFPFMYDKMYTPMYTPILFFDVIHIHLMLHVQIVQKQILPTCGKFTPTTWFIMRYIDEL